MTVITTAKSGSGIDMENWRWINDGHYHSDINSGRFQPPSERGKFLKKKIKTGKNGGKGKKWKKEEGKGKKRKE